MNDGSPPLRMIWDEPYVMTLVLVTRKGALVTKVIDSRFDDVEEAWEEMKNSEKSKEIVYRLMLAEDLPTETERLLEKLLQGDRRILIDHAANRIHGWLRSLDKERSKSEFHMNISEPPAAISVALPYEIHGATKVPVDYDTETVDLRFARSIFEKLYGPLHCLGERWRDLPTEWFGLPACGHNRQHFLYIAYRRISLQFSATSCQESPICVILMYPQLRFVECGDVEYSLSRDLVHPPTPVQRRDSVVTSPTNGMRKGNIADVSATLLHYLATQLGVGDQTTITVRTTISRWMVINTQATFRESIKNFVDYWCALSKMIQSQNRPVGDGQKIVVEIEDCLGTFSEAVATQISQLRKAKAEIEGRESAEVMDADPMEGTHLDPMNLDGLEWYRMMNCLESIFASTRRELHKREQCVQVAMTNMQIRESQTAIKQAETVKRLTQLAFIFIPISVTCSAFGMNIQELVHSPPSVWVSLLVMLGVTLATISCSLESTHKVFWSIGKLFGSLVPKKSSSSKARDWAYNEIVDEDSAREGWSWPKSLPWLIRQFKRLVRVLNYTYRTPLAVVQRVIRGWSSAQEASPRDTSSWS